jgi:hypothetical protein
MWCGNGSLKRESEACECFGAVLIEDGRTADFRACPALNADCAKDGYATPSTQLVP